MNSNHFQRIAITLALISIITVFLLSSSQAAIPRKLTVQGRLDENGSLADGNYDTHTGKTGRASAGLNVRRSPRLSYFAGIRYIGPLDSSVGTIGTTYELTR